MVGGLPRGLYFCLASRKKATNLSKNAFHPVPAAVNVYADVILPLAIARPYTYAVPEELLPELKTGMRVEVQFGKSRLYTGLVLRLHQEMPAHQKTKSVLSIIDEAPIVTDRQFELWRWMAAYYGCTLGEVMNAALPANFKLTSETRVTLGPLFHQDQSQLNDKEYLITEALTIQEELSIDDIQGILGHKTIYPIIRRLLDKRIIYLKEDLKEKYRPKTVSCVRLAEPFSLSEPGSLTAAFQAVANAPRQEEILLAYLTVAKQQDFVRRQDLVRRTEASYPQIDALAKKGILEIYDREISRIGSYEEETVAATEMSSQQNRALEEIRGHFADKNVVLLHGVTGSGKTRIYLELMREVMAAGGQVLYLLPEIALTTQIIQRMQRVLGDAIGVYHSRLNHNERVELWNQVRAGQPAVLGPRSALFLPFNQLSLVIVDEEHDPSYKQREPNPRYQGRDTAIMLAHLHGAKVLLGTATPALESMHNARLGKYGLVTMMERYGGIALPETIIADARREEQEQRLHGHFTATLLDALKACIERGEQAILFQNRRGYSPAYRCPTCGWHAECVHCDVSLTYHKFHHALKCHYCGYSTKLPVSCPACGNQQLLLQGFGTEKIEDDLKIFLPDARIARMDLDTVRGKHAYAKLIHEFEEGKLDVLVGTQMVTKGLDFERVGVVGVISADQLLQFPDFRSAERGFQLMVQVAGRAGRKHRKGQVIVQTFNPTHPVIQEVLANDYAGFFRREIGERQDFHYPPFTRLIRVTLKHKKPQTVNDAMRLFAHWLQKDLKENMIGPAVPPVGKVRGYYLLDILLKLPNQPAALQHAKKRLAETTANLQVTEGYSNVRVSVDVDPY